MGRKIWKIKTCIHTHYYFLSSMRAEKAQPSYGIQAHGAFVVVYYCVVIVWLKHILLLIKSNIRIYHSFLAVYSQSGSGSKQAISVAGLIITMF